MDMVLGFLPASVKPEGEKQSTKLEDGERADLCPLCLCSVDLSDDYGTVIFMVSGRRFCYHLYPCLAGPVEYDV